MLHVIAMAFAFTIGISACSEDEGGAAGQSSDQSSRSDGAAETLDLSTPEGALLANRKIHCSLEDGKAVTYSWRGRAYSRVPGERDRLLFNVEGMNVRHCISTEDSERGQGYRLIAREILLYIDPQTGRPLRQWENPWTSKTVGVLHVANDPVNSENFVKMRNGEDLKWTAQSHGDQWWDNLTVPLFYRNVLAGDYQKYIGGTYHATEMFNFFGSLSDLTDLSKDTADISVGWVRQSDWLPWMEMQGRVGTIYMHTAGTKLKSWDDMPDVIKNEIRTNYPDYVGPPPLDDDRPNETSWTYFKTVKDSERDAAGETD